MQVHQITQTRKEIGSRAFGNWKIETSKKQRTVRSGIFNFSNRTPQPYASSSITTTHKYWKPKHLPTSKPITTQQQPPVSQMQNALSTAHTNSQEIQETATYIQPGLPLRWVANSHAKKTGRCVRSSRRFGFILGAITVAFELRPRSSLDTAGENLVTCLTVFYLAWLVVTARDGMTFENCVSVCLFVVRKHCKFGYIQVFILMWFCVHNLFILWHLYNIFEIVIILQLYWCP